MKSRSRFSKGHDSSDQMSLQITSMADIFTIILVFLLKSFATSSVNIAPTAGLMIPKAQAASPQIEAIKLEISENSILVESKPITQLDHFHFHENDLTQNRTATSLNHALDIEKQRQLLIAKSNPNVKVDNKILIIADQRTPYSTVKSALASAALNGFTDFKLVVVQKE